MLRHHELLESNVRYYSRKFPCVFSRAKGSLIFDEEGQRWIDFFAGAGALNLGHNNTKLKNAVIDYLEQDGIAHGLDMYTTARFEFMKKFDICILRPRNLSYKIQITAPTGTNSIEAAILLARKVTNRDLILAFSGGFHGMTLGSRSISATLRKQSDRCVDSQPVEFLEYPCSNQRLDNITEQIRVALTQNYVQSRKPAAIVLETVQAEGGINIAPIEWLQELRAICSRNGILLIVDDIQVGCGRVGEFFSFERAHIIPDIVALSKSISGLGQPMSLLLIKPEYDQWAPGEFNGTFRGNQLAFVASCKALDIYGGTYLYQTVKANEKFINQFFNQKILPIDHRVRVRGIGMLWGLDFGAFDNYDMAQDIQASCFKRGLIVETAGRHGQVIKLLPPLTIPRHLLFDGLTILAESIRQYTVSAN